MPRQPRLDARPLPSSGFRFPKSGLRVPGFGKMRTPEFLRIGNSPEGEADPPATARHEQAGGGQAPGALHHVMGRGIDGVKIFSNRKDREDFLERLADLCRADALSAYAWALMGNHYHSFFPLRLKGFSPGLWGGPLS